MPTIGSEKHQLGFKPEEDGELESKAPQSNDSELQSLRRTLAERDAKIASLQKQLDWAFSVVQVQEKLAANDATIAQLREDVDDLKSSSADKVSAFPYREVVAQTEPIVCEIKKVTRDFTELKDQVFITDVVRAACGHPGERGNASASSDHLSNSAPPDEVASEVQEEFEVCERVFVEQARYIKALKEQVDKLKSGRLGELIGKTIKDFME